MVDPASAVPPASLAASSSRTHRRRGRRHEQSDQPAPLALPYVTRRIPPYDLLGEEALVAIETTADRILAEIGVDVRQDPESLALLRAAGAEVTSERVRFPQGLARGIVKRSAPASFEQRARNPDRSVRFGKDSLVFSPAYGPPFVRASDMVRRYSTLADFETIVKLVYSLPALHHSGGTVCEPTDQPVTTRHLDMVRAHLTLSDKPFMGSVTSGERAADSIHMAEIVLGKEVVAENCCLLGLINLNSPLVLDGTMLAALRTYAAAGQGTVITPFVIGGAAGPVTAAGMLAQALAEALAGMAIAQLVRPGAPVIFGYLSTGLDMRSGAPVRYEETWQCYLAAGQLARRLGVPFRTGATTSTSKLPDYQAGLESAMALQAAVLSGAHFLIHATGNLEAGLCLDLDKLVLDAELLAVAARFAAGPQVCEATLALEAVREVGPGGNFLAASHTLARYRDAFHSSALFDTASFEQWRERGECDAVSRAASHRERLLADYRRPEMDVAVGEALDDFIARRKRELPASFA
ncbi:MAG: trimethylamine methyltransferase [Rhizobiales bacterium]|nr:trimethylamine methyltransferase [Hyphomicrobiales bacterium]